MPQIIPMWVSRIVARASGLMRDQGKADPVDSAHSITPELLAELGVSEGDVESTLLATYSTRVLNSLRASDGNSALLLVKGMLEALAHSKHAGDPVAAEIWFTSARAYYRRGDIRRACGAMTRAAIVHPPFVAKIPWRGIRGVARRVI